MIISSSDIKLIWAKIQSDAYITVSCYTPALAYLSDEFDTIKRSPKIIMGTNGVSIIKLPANRDWYAYAHTTDLSISLVTPNIIVEF